MIRDDEFALLEENAVELGLPWAGPPPVARRFADVGGLRVSVLHWQEGEPALVLLHGGAQNAHTWDSVALALGRPLLAVDLPGHGHSDWRSDHDYWPETNAATLADLLERLVPHPAVLVGMSLGGLTAICLAARQPERVRRLVVVDVTPGTDSKKSGAIAAFVNGPASFESFDEILAHTVRHHPHRSLSSLRRGVLHNAIKRDDRWVWRYDRLRPPEHGIDFTPLWDEVSRLRSPTLLVRGGLSPVVDDADVAEFLRRQPTLRVETFARAGHSVQSDCPAELAALIERFGFGPSES